MKIVNYMTSIKYCNQVDGWSMLLETQTDRTEAGFKQTDQKKKFLEKRGKVRWANKKKPRNIQRNIEEREERRGKKREEERRKEKKEKVSENRAATYRRTEGRVGDVL